MEQKSPRRSMSDIRPARPMDTIVRPAAGARPAPQPVAPTPQPVAAPQQPVAPVYAPEPEPVVAAKPVKQRKKRTGLVVTLVILIPLIAAAVAYYLFIFKATAY